MINLGKLSWIINNACNLRCVHCYPDSGIETKKAFDDKDFNKIRENLQGIHFSRVFLSGGEPILDKYFYRYLEIALEISDDVFICSNGTLLTDEKLAELVRSGVKGVVLSLQALDPKLAQTIYGNPKVPELVFDAINRVKDHGLSLGVEMTIMKCNMHVVDELITKLSERNVDFISFKRLLPVGRGASEEICVSQEEQYATLKKIYRWQIEHPEIRFNVHDPLYGTILYDSFYELTNDEAIIHWMKSFACRAGTKWIGIDPDGNVSPCPILLYKDLLVGNILDAPIDQILNESSIVKKFRDAASISSHSCKYGSYCLGCRATAIAKANDIFAKDPMCIHSEGVCPITELCKGENI